MNFYLNYLRDKFGVTPSDLSRFGASLNAQGAIGLDSIYNIDRVCEAILKSPGVRAGAMTVNEYRESKGMLPISEGEVILTPATPSPRKESPRKYPRVWCRLWRPLFCLITGASLGWSSGWDVPLAYVVGGLTVLLLGMYEKPYPVEPIHLDPAPFPRLEKLWGRR